MLEECKTAQEKWGGVSEIVDRWLLERKDLLVQFCALSNIVNDNNNGERGDGLQRLCQIMVDYVSAGHFEVYDQLMQEGREFNDQDGLRHASKSFETVDSSTEFILDFNDKYQETDDLEALAVDLSKLGEVLAARFEAEDQMIEVLHVAHRDQVAS